MYEYAQMNRVECISYGYGWILCEFYMAADIIFIRQ